VKKLTKLEARDFFAEVYRGAHHIPSAVRYEDADGKLTSDSDDAYAWCVVHYGELASYDHDLLTRLVIAGHERRVRVAIRSAGPRYMRVTITRREGEEARTRGCEMSEYHPSIEESVEVFRSHRSWAMQHHERRQTEGSVSA
jgi:hypothetical protein